SAANGVRRAWQRRGDKKSGGRPGTRLYAPSMRVALLVIAAAALGATVVGGLLRRALTDRVRTESQRAERAEGELRQHERSAREDQAVQELILSSMEEGVLLVDRDGRPVFANAALER